MKVTVEVPSKTHANYLIGVDLFLKDNKIEFSTNFNKFMNSRTKAKKLFHGYDKKELLEAAQAVYLAQYAEQEQQIAKEEVVAPPQKVTVQDSILGQQSMFAKIGLLGLAGACVVPSIALGVMTAFIAPLTALFPSFIALAGVATGILLMSAIIGALAGMAIESISPPDKMKAATV